MKWGIAYIVCIDLTMIIISIVGLSILRAESWSTQLWIILVESIVLALLSIILACWEFYTLKQMLKYTEDIYAPKKQNMGKFKKKLTMQAIKKVNSNTTKIFKDRKLEELVHMFGTRGCRSIYEHTTG